MSDPLGPVPSEPAPGIIRIEDTAESNLIEMSTQNLSDTNNAADENSPQQQSTPKRADVVGISEQERNLLDSLRSLHINPSELQDTLQRIPSTQSHEENASGDADADLQTQPKFFGGQTEVGVVPPPGSRRQPPHELLLGGGGAIPRARSFGSANAPRRPPPQGGGGVQMPPAGGAASLFAQAAAGGYLPPPPPPQQNINPFNLGLPPLLAPTSIAQTSASGKMPPGLPPMQQHTTPPAVDGQAILAQLALLLNNQQQLGGGADATALHKISKMEIPKFRGRKDTKSPYEYLKIIKNEARMSNIDPFLIVRHKLPITMIEEAGLWLTFHTEFTCWDDFEVAFTEEYSAVNYIQRLKKELEVRTQGPQEPLTTYIHIITEMCKMIDPRYPEADIIEKIIDLMHPEYRQYIRGQHFISLFALEAYAKRVQQSFYQDRTYRLPPSLEESVEKSFCYNNRSEKYVKFGSSEKEKSNSVALSALNPQIGRDRARQRYKGKREYRDDSKNRRFELNRSHSGSREASESRSGSAHSSQSRTSSTGSTSSKRYHSKKAEARSDSESPRRKNDKRDDRKSKKRPATPQKERKSKN